VERAKYFSEKDKLKEEIHGLQKTISEQESLVRRLKDNIEFLGEEKKRNEDRFDFEMKSLLENYGNEKKKAETLQVELHEKSQMFEEKSREWKRTLDEMVYKKREELDNLKRENKNMEEDYEKELKEVKEEAANGREICEKKTEST